MRSIFVFSFPALAFLPAAVAKDDCTSSYTQQIHGQLPYGNDGGCFFCGRFKGSSFPISNLNDLSTNCKMLCENDPECTAYSISREAALHAHEYYWGGSANCCLEREEYPPETFIDARNGTDELTICEKEMMCWTRYEKDDEVSSKLTNSHALVLCDKKKKRAKRDSAKLCRPIWKARKFSDKRTKKHTDFIKTGCKYKSKTFISMLDHAYQQCKAEIEDEEQALAEAQEVDQAQELAQKSPFTYTDGQQSAWLAHGVIGAITFGVLSPLSAFGPWYPNLIPTQAHTAILVSTFALTFVTVFISFRTKQGLGENSDSGAKEEHQIIGLVLLLLLCLQTLGSIHREQKGTMTQKLIRVTSLFVFGLGVIEVKSGCFLYASNYDVVYWGQVYLGYIAWLLVVILSGKLVMKYRGRSNIEYTHVHTKAFELT